MCNDYRLNVASIVEDFADLKINIRFSEARPNVEARDDIKITDVASALLCELGFPWRICRGIVVISRAVGLVGHLAEEMRNPLAREIWERAEAEVYNNKD